MGYNENDDPSAFAFKEKNGRIWLFIEGILKQEDYYFSIIKRGITKKKYHELMTEATKLYVNGDRLHIKWIATESERNRVETMAFEVVAEAEGGITIYN